MASTASTHAVMWMAGRVLRSMRRIPDTRKNGEFDDLLEETPDAVALQDPQR